MPIIKILNWTIQVVELKNVSLQLNALDTNSHTAVNCSLLAVSNYNIVFFAPALRCGPFDVNVNHPYSILQIYKSLVCHSEPIGFLCSFLSI